MGLFPKKPKKTLEQVIQEGIAEHGLGATTEYWTAIKESYDTGGRFSMGLLGSLWGQFSGRAVEILGGLAPRPVPTPGSPGQTSKTASSRRRKKGRASTILTGGLGNIGASHKTLLGD